MVIPAGGGVFMTLHFIPQDPEYKNQETKNTKENRLRAARKNSLVFQGNKA